MNVDDAIKWVDATCTEGMVARVRSCAVAKALSDEIRRQEELVHDLAGVLWRLEKYGYIGREVEDSEREECDYLRELGRQVVALARSKMP